jgi:hypothetical protein
MRAEDVLQDIAFGDVETAYIDENKNRPWYTYIPGLDLGY